MTLLISMMYFLGGASHVMLDFVNINTAFILYWILMSCVFYFPRLIAVGQVLRATPVKEFYVKNKKAFKSVQEVSGIIIA